MISDEQVISVEKVNQLSDFKLELEFNDKTRQVINFYPFLSRSLNPLIRKYPLVPKLQLGNAYLQALLEEY